MADPQAQADAFVAANDASPVVEGWAIEPDPRKPAKGGRYRLDNDTILTLDPDAHRLLPPGYPKWKGL